MNIRKMKPVAVAFTAAAILGLGLTGCGGGGSSGESAVVLPVTKSCADLNGMVIPAALIDLPTTGGTGIGESARSDCVQRPAGQLI